MFTKSTAHFIKHFSSIIALLWITIFAPACYSPLETITLPTPFLSVQEYTQTPHSTPTQAITPSITVVPLNTQEPTPNPFLDLYIESLKLRKYGGGVLQDKGNLNGADGFSRKLFKFRSEGLDLYGFMNIPEGDGPFPIIFLLHGYVDPGKYKTLDYSVRYTDALVEAGYITIHPNLRGYQPSDSGENILGIGDTVDLLNLLALVRQQSGSAGLLKKADGTRIGLWGHSMGGGIVMRALIVNQEINAGLLYAAINSDEELNLSHFEKDGRGNDTVPAYASDLEKISPSSFLNEISSPISIHHGGQDDVVPIEWSRDLCDTLGDLEIEVKCNEYPDQPHTFQNSGDSTFISNMIEFFDAYVK